MPRFKPFAKLGSDSPWREGRSLPYLWMLLLVVLLVLGTGLRWAQLEQRIFWVDEVATAVRIGGYTEADVVAEVTNSPVLTPADLLRYVRGPEMRSPQATLQALIQSPEHAPLYFLLARQWTALLGRTPETLRSLSVILSLLTLPALYWLCWEWMQAPIPGWLAMGLMASSPLLIAYAQEARPYSLWVLLLVLSGGMLLRSLNRPHVWNWAGYSMTLSLTLYTSLLSIPLAIAQGIYLFGLEKGRLTRTVRWGWGAIAASFAAFLPWLVVVVTQWDTLQRNTVWMQQPMGLVERIGIWIYTLSILIFDTPVAPLGTPLSHLQIFISLMLLGVFSWALVGLVQHTSPRIWGFVLALGLPTPLLLMLADLILGGKRSTAPRYWIPTHLALILILAGWLGIQATSKYYPRTWRRRWRKVLALVLAIALACSGGNVWRSPRYLKTRNIHNPAIAAILNQSATAYVVAEPTEVYDLISLSQFLDPTIQIQVRMDPSQQDGQTKAFLNNIPPCPAETFIFNPSDTLVAQLSRGTQGRYPQLSIQEAYRPSRLTPDEMALSLWRVIPPVPCP